MRDDRTTADEHFQFTAGEIQAMRRNPEVLAFLMDHHEARYTEATAIFGDEDAPTGNKLRKQALYERGRSLMAEDLDAWPDDLRRSFGFPPFAEPTNGPDALVERLRQLAPRAVVLRAIVMAAMLPHNQAKPAGAVREAAVALFGQENVDAALEAAAPSLVGSPLEIRVNTPPPKFARGDVVRKRSGSQWQGRVVGEYSTTLTPEGYAVESDTHAGSVQIYPAAALELVARRQTPNAEVPTEADAYDMGATGGPAHEGERLAFESWMRGHCWALCATWTGTQYRSDAEQGGDVDPRAMRTRQLWAAWRDRAALARG